MLHCTNCLICIYALVQFSITNVEQWEKEEYDQLSSNSLGDYNYCIRLFMSSNFLATRENISESWQAKYVNLLDTHEEIW